MPVVPFTCPNCGCRDIVPGNCCGCLSFPARYTFTLSGVINQVCTNCVMLNRTYTLIYTGGSNCSWNQRLDPPGPCEDLHTLAELSCQQFDQLFFLRFQPSLGFELASYMLPAAQWNCLGTNIVELVSDDNSCDGWPATITLVPG